MSAQQEIEESIDLADEQERKRNEQLRRLADAVSKCGYVIQCNVPYDGNCFFHAVAIHTGGDGTIIRKSLVDFLVSERVSSDLKMAIDEELLINLKQPSAAVNDDTVCKAVAEFTGRDVVVITSDPDDAMSPAIVHTFRHCSSSSDLQPVVLGHIMDTHFVPLKCITTVKRKAPKTVSVTKKKTTKGSVTITDFFSKPHRRDSSHDTSDGNVGTTDTQCTSSAHHPDTEEIPTSDASACSSPSHSPAPVQEQCSKCTAVCCLPNAKPHQPTSEAALKATSMQVGNKREHRSFQKKWYRDHPWITLCSTNNKAYCHTCRAMAGTLSLSKHTEPAFTGDGFCSW